MSAQPDSPVPAGPVTSLDVPGDGGLSVVPPSVHQPDRTTRPIVGREAPAHLPIPAGPLALAAVGVYGVVTIAAGGFASVGLASIPLFVAAALLPARSALVTGMATLAVTLLPPIARHDWVVEDLVLLSELTILVVAALVLRGAVAQLVVTRSGEAEAGHRLQERIHAVLEIAERLTRTFDRAEIFETVVAETQRILAVDGVTIRVLRDGALEVAATAGMEPESARLLPVFRADEGWFREVFRTGRPWACDDLSKTVPEYQAMVARYLPGHGFAADLVVPLIGQERVIGAVSAASDRPRHWSEADIEFVRALATHASIAIANADLFEQASTRAAQMGVLQAASARMTRQNSVESVGRAIVEETRRIIDYHNARVYVLDGDRLLPIAFAGTVGAYEKVDFALLETRLGVGFTGWAAEHGTALLIPDANADPRGSTIPGTDDVDESMLVVPMRYDERVTGAITLSKLGLRQFSDEDLRLLMILADQAATALQSVRLLARAQGLAGELRRLLDMSGELAHSLDPLEVADLIAQHLAGALGVDECAISYWDRPGDRVVTWGYFPPVPPEELEVGYRLTEYPTTRRVLEEGVTVTLTVDDPDADPGEVALLRAKGSHALVMLPLVAKGHSIGLVELISRTPTELDPGRIGLARSMANEAAMALENAKLYEDARELADHDHLTGFANHRYLHERLGEEIVRSQRSKSPLSVLMIDLDDFKLVNDTFGHLFGDRVLVWSAELIRSSLRASDVPARYGGDEFAVILPDTDATAASAVAQRILDGFRDRGFESDGRGPVPVSASIGQATFPADGRAARELIAAADRAMYLAKNSGGRAAALARGAVPEAEGGARTRGSARRQRVAATPASTLKG